MKRTNLWLHFSPAIFRHQLELAIAFFLLGGDTYSAITICAKNFGDEQLALIICRLIEGRGGPLEHHLITKFILPSASERGDYWLTSLLEWELGNYSQSFLSMLGLQASSMTDKSPLSSNNAAFMDPHIGLHCLSLVSKNSMRNAAGEQSAAILGRWATIMAATAFNRRGLPLWSAFHLL
uniref:RAVE complex protein Rav1 C-terminal domain-containing protein n=1 Tax=Salix viminalis TaxID=40686 RepID=A0A6N2KYH2_SALVM